MTLGDAYDASFYARHRDGARRSAAVVVPLLIDLVGPRSVVDVGCGTGVWLAEFRERGVEDVVGIDGDHVDEGALEIAVDAFVPHDLTRPLYLERRFDLVVSLEVAEHIPVSDADAFLDTLAALGEVVVFSAAIPHQGGNGHVNERWPAWWAQRFRARGYEPIDCLRRRLWRDERVAWWYAQNTIVYATPSAIGARPRLTRARDESGCADPIPLVHPVRYLEWIEWALEELYGDT